MNSKMDGPPRKIVKLSEQNSSVIARDEAAFSKEEIESLLDTKISISKKVIKVEQSIFSECHFDHFTGILNGDAINNCEPHNLNDIKAQCEKLVELCALKLDEDSFTLLDLLAMIFDPNNKFHTATAASKSESVVLARGIPEEELYARPPPSPKNPRGWLVDLINKFGNLGGFVILHSRFQPGRRSLTIPMIYAHLRPFGLCYDLLTVDTIVKYLMPIVKRIPVIWDNLTDEELKQANNESISDTLLATIRIMEDLASRVSKQELIKNLKSLKLRMILRLLQIFETIPESLATVVGGFNSIDLDQFFEYFQTSWMNGDEKTREKLLTFIRPLAKDDRDGVIIHKVLTLFWNLAHLDEISTEIMEQALNAHVKILDYPCPQDRDVNILIWLDKCFKEFTSDDKWTVPAIKLIREICNLYQDESNSDIQLIPNVFNRKKVVRELHARNNNFWDQVASSVVKYMHKVRQLVAKNPKIDATLFMPDGRYTHAIQVQERLDFMRFTLRNARWSLATKNAKEIWQCLVERKVFPSDREIGFKWFSESIINADPDFYPLATCKDFFERHMLQLDPTFLTENGFTCFERFFKTVNVSEGKLKKKDGLFIMSDLDLIGNKYLWRIVVRSPQEIANRGVKLLKEVNRHVSPELKISAYHQTLIGECMRRLQTYYNVRADLWSKCNVQSSKQQEQILKNKVAIEEQKMCRVMNIMQEYMKEGNTSN